MKYYLLLLVLSLFYFSCTQKEESVHLNTQTEAMKKDPVVTKYFEALAASAKIMAEGGLDLSTYQAIIAEAKQDVCDVDKKIFNGDVEMENFAHSKCLIKISGQKFFAKYPFVKQLDEADKRELLTPLMIEPDYNMDKIKRNAERKTLSYKVAN